MRKQHARKGDVRVRTKFLLFPKRIEYETRWFEVASWEEVCKLYLRHGAVEYLAWTETRWL